MIDSNREEFEKLSEIAERIKRSEAFYCSKGDWYLSPHEGCREDEEFLDGAWYAFQEQQKKLDCCREENKALLDKLNVPNGYKLVPVEINDEIESAMLSSVARGEMPCDIYKAMIGAAAWVTKKPLYPFYF